VGFEERFSLLGGANLKNFSGSVPNEALGAGRVTLDFVDQPVQPAVDMANLAKYWNKEQRLITASNGQMRWDYSGRGFITTDTPVAQAVIGFGGGREHRLSTATVRYDVPFANVYLAARKPGETLADAKEIVVLTLARTANRGDVLEETSMAPFATAEKVEKSKNPEEARAFQMANPRLLIEPVKATITLARSGPCTVIALDHDGCAPAQTKPIAVRQVAGGVQFDLDGAAAQAFTYLVTFP
jgi:hypothetical protein